jgi:hypothetical protein
VQPLHGHAEVAADHRGQAVGLALEGQLDRALDLLVVLQLDLEELDQLDGEAGRPGDADAAEYSSAARPSRCRGSR